MEEPHADTGRPVAGVVVTPLSEVVSAAELHELHEVVFGADGHLESADLFRQEIVSPVGTDGDFVGVGEEGIECDAAVRSTGML